MVRTFAKVLLVNQRGEILFMCRSAADDARPGGWDFPGGNVESSEEPLAGVIRETSEEAGIQLHDPQLVFASPRTGAYGVGCWLLYLAYVPDDTTITLSEEHSGYKWWTPEEALANSDYPMHQELLQFIIDNRLLDTHVPKTVTCRMLAVNEAGELLILRRSVTDPFYGGTWDLPGGRAEPGEQPLATAIRETREECDISVANPALVFGTSNPRRKGTGTWLFYHTFVPKSTTIALSNEHDQYQWISADDLPKYTNYEVLLRMHAFVSTHRLYGGK